MRFAIRGSRLLVMGALLSLAPCLLAQVNLQINNPPSNNVLDGIYVGSYSATNTSTGAQMQITCDDFKDNSDYNRTTYTSSAFGSFGNTLWGSLIGAATFYDKAAWLTLGMLNQTGLTQGYYSYAIWAVFDATDVLNWLKQYNDTAACNAVFGAGNNCSSTQVTSGGLLSNAQQNYMNGNYSNFVILTPQGCKGGAGSCPEQEFLELMPVPEGGSTLAYLLLAGISCFGAIIYCRRQTVRPDMA